jgi:hypothetical protein
MTPLLVLASEPSALGGKKESHRYNNGKGNTQEQALPLDCRQLLLKSPIVYFVLRSQAFLVIIPTS